VVQANSGFDMTGIEEPGEFASRQRRLKVGFSRRQRNDVWWQALVPALKKPG